MTSYHIIGDIHGHAEKLEALLQHLGYTKNDGIYQQDSAKVVFLGDFIDRGPHQRRVIDWFKTLPIYLEVKDTDDSPVSFRAVHACWNQAIINRTPQYIDDAHILAATEKGSLAYKDIEILLKGLEIPPPDGATFLDKAKVERHEIRVRW